MPHPIGRARELLLVAQFILVGLTALAPIPALAQSARYCATERAFGRYPAGCPRRTDSTVRPATRESATRPPASRSAVVLAPSGGDATSLAQALSIVAPGGTIRIRPGNYGISREASASPSPLAIEKSVRLLGETVNGQRPILTGIGVAIESPNGHVVIQNLEIRGTNGQASLWLPGSRDSRVDIISSRIVSTTPNHLAILAEGANVNVTDCEIESTGGDGMLIRGGSISISGSSFRSQGTALVIGSGANNVAVRNSTIVSIDGIAINSDSSLQLSSSHIDVRGNHEAVMLGYGVHASLIDNVVTTATTRPWLYIRSAYPSASFQDNRDENGRRLIVPAPHQP